MFPSSGSFGSKPNIRGSAPHGANMNHFFRLINHSVDDVFLTGLLAYVNFLPIVYLICVNFLVGGLAIVVIDTVTNNVLTNPTLTNVCSAILHTLHSRTNC